MTVVENKIELIYATEASAVEHTRQLFLEYAKSLNFSLCFQNFDKELESLPGAYSPPTGRLLVAMRASEPAGCVGLRRLDERACEMKRLYVRPTMRGLGVGRLLVDRIIEDAHSIGYKQMRLDTVAPIMNDAIAIYRKRGFREIPPYCANPEPGALYMQLDL
jgi:ribosomal protein S18 acetylase RimI-like enzyme